jgi:catechol 2,3-dioxygenase-like lactoylglutathione lyase family enzyme
MTVNFHHISVFVSDMDRALYLFQDILGFELSWRMNEAKGKSLSALLGIEELEAELIYLTSTRNGVSIELCRLIHPDIDTPGVRFGTTGTVGISIAVQNLDRLHGRLNQEGWIPFSPCIKLRTPEGEKVRAFCFAMEKGTIVELIENVL